MKTNMRWMLGLIAVLGPLTLAVGQQGCGTAHDVCEVYCDCVLCNDREEDECIIDANRGIDLAAEYECEPESEALSECIISDGDCDDDTNTFSFGADDECGDELQDYLECINDQSDCADMGCIGLAGGIPSEGEGEGEGEGQGNFGGTGLTGNFGGSGLTGNFGGAGLTGGFGGAGGF